jgi:pilus assembly protein Flp/PilA
VWTIRQFLRDDGGATGIEYGLIAGLLALAIVAGVGSVGDAVESMFADQDSALRQAFDR